MNYTGLSYTGSLDVSGIPLPGEGSHITWVEIKNSSLIPQDLHVVLVLECLLNFMTRKFEEG